LTIDKDNNIVYTFYNAININNIDNGDLMNTEKRYTTTKSYVIFVDQAQELSRRAEGESTSMSKFMQKLLDEYFANHPQPAPAGAGEAQDG